METEQKKPEGRPTVFTEQLLQKLEEAFLLGCTDEEACLFADIAPSSLYNYQKDRPEFLERKNVLKNNPVLKARTEVVNGFKGNPDLALKFLERKKKDEFSLRTELTGEDGKAIRFENLTDEQLDAKLSELIETKEN
jgi:hypothetical protein